MGAFVRVMVALKRVNAGIERWGLNGCIEKDQRGALVRVNAGI